MLHVNNYNKKKLNSHFGHKKKVSYLFLVRNFSFFFYSSSIFLWYEKKRCLYHGSLFFLKRNSLIFFFKMIFLIRNERFQCIFSKQRTRFLFKILIFYLFFTTENTIHLLIYYKKHFIHILNKNPNKKKIRLQNNRLYLVEFNSQLFQQLEKSSFSWIYLSVLGDFIAK